MIRQLFSVIILMLACAMHASGQDGLRLGLTGGLGFSRSITLDSIPKNFTYRMKSGFNIGANLHVGFTRVSGLSTGLLYVQKGYRIYNDTNTGGNVIRGMGGNLEIPVAITFRQTLSSLSFVRASAGLALNVSLNSKDNIAFENDNRSFRINQVQTGKIYPMLALGFEFGSETDKGNMFMFGAHYKQAFARNSTLNIFNSASPSASKLFDLGFRGSYISIQLTYLFNMTNLKKAEEFYY